MGMIITMVCLLMGGSLFLIDMNRNIKKENPNENYVKVHKFLIGDRLAR